MPTDRLDLVQARELNQLDKFAAEQDSWLIENGFKPKPETATEAVLSTVIKSEKSANQT